MANSTETKPAAEKNCRCQLGWTGTAGSGSTLTAAEDYAIPCDRMTKNAFAQGHDARMSSRLATEVAKGETERDVARKLIELAGGSSLLISKTMRSADLRAAKLNRVPSAKKQAADEAERTVPENKANAATNDDEAEAISRVRAAVRDEVPPVMNPSEDDDTDGDAPDTLPEIGDEVQVTHGKRSYTATIKDIGDGELIAQHGLFGKLCNHDPFTGEVINTVASDEAPEF